MATSYPYDQHEDGQLALRSHASEISQHLKNELAERLADAGVQVIDARISHLAYAAEIAQAMLQRQQANAVIAARTRIVAGAVGMVEMALAELQKNGVVQLDEERKAHMVSNLLTVLCSDRGTQPIVNAGSLEKKAYPLRINAEVLAAAQRWADDELRSLNAQIEYVLRDALRKAGRLPKPKPSPEDKE
ncbi:hypothetical protein G6F35_015189 [Rhizopus arrhizus]|nr:hypothetical protein G6F35_015189 [Rhizopus arrhizus]